MLFKQKVYSGCLQLLEDKIKNLHTALQELKSGAENDAKSSAGDKHETARAMMQIEHENISRQLEELQHQQTDLKKIDIAKSLTTITTGSLIKSNNIYFFLSVAIGTIKVEGTSVIIFSPQSPLGLKMKGCHAGDTVEVNNKKFVIEEIS